MVTLCPEHDDTVEVDRNSIEKQKDVNITKSDASCDTKFKFDNSLYNDTNEGFINWNVTDVTNFVNHENIVEVLSHNTQEVSIISKKNKGTLKDLLKNNKMKDSETNFINNFFKFENKDKDEPQNENLSAETEKMKNTSISDTSLTINIEHLFFSKKSELTNLENLNSAFSSLEVYVDMYLSKYISSTYKHSYFKKIKNVEETCRILDFYRLSYDEHSTIFKILPKKELIEKLKMMSEQFDKSSIFNQETCDKFMVEFDLKIFNIYYSEDFRNKIFFLSSNQQRLFFYNEVLKLYKYVPDIPELLVLLGLFKNKSCKNVIFVTHLINLFIENVNDNKVFISCMIYKALICFNSARKFDAFMIPFYEVECCQKKYNIYHFMWELGSFIRAEIKSRIQNNYPKNLREKIQLKLVFLIFLYRHFIFLKFSSVRSGDILSFKKLIDKVCFSKDCFIDLYHEFLDLIRTSSNNLNFECSLSIFF